MSGITTAGYIRKTLGLVVFQADVEGVPHCVVKQGDRELARHEDDVWGTLCVVMLAKLTDAVKKGRGVFRKFVAPPASSFFKFDLDSLCAQFDPQLFVDTVLPLVKKNKRFDDLVNEWTRISDNTYWNGTTSQKFEFYDWYVDLRVRMRTAFSAKTKMLISGKAVPAMSALGNIATADLVDLSGSDHLVAAFQSFYPKGQVVDGVFVCHPENYMVNEFGFRTCSVPVFDMDFSPRNVRPVADTKHQAPDSDSPLVSDEDVEKLVGLLTRTIQSYSAEELENAQHGGHPELLEQGIGFGKSALRGWKVVMGEGLVKDCLTRMVRHLSCRSSAPIDDLIDFVISRVGNMKGDYDIKNVVIKDAYGNNIKARHLVDKNLGSQPGNSPFKRRF